MANDAQPTPLDKLVTQLELDRLDRDLFLGDAGEGQWRLFGGLVAAQSVVAAYRTVDDPASSMHSLHAYFLRPGRHVPIRYVVYRIRDSRTFTTRDVVAYQSGEAIFNLSCSFAKPEDGRLALRAAAGYPIARWSATVGVRPPGPSRGSRDDAALRTRERRRGAVD